ncbi:extracellular catalytic domain type 1 short-chain-length polyhydroxyalkanoate depolymerase [Methylobacterium oxalidis]|uniref:extracellular catalytic domain type 1 short-chain-length polyhydroxyalkanoate depolymerase n=1 Tax=Methylobacterium oxalidis TaxID=944322 RepID=UPI003315D9C4
MTDHAARMQVRLADMLEATRLTGAGRLDEATALIQRNLRERPAPARPPQPEAIEPPTIDLVAERVADAPRGDEAPRPDEGRPGRRPANDADRWVDAEFLGDGTHPAIIPERLREVLRGLGRGVAPVLKGLNGVGLNGLGLNGAGSGPGLSPGPLPGARHGRPPQAGEGRFVARSFSDRAGARDYKLFIPSRPAAAPSLVVMLHGCTQSPDDFAAGTNMNALAEADGIYVAYPAQSARANGQRCWNWFQPGDQGREAGEAAIIAGLTRAVVAEFGIDPKRVYIAGLSAGGAAAANIALAYPDLYAAVGVHSGLAAGCARDLSSALMAMQIGAPGQSPPTGFGATAEGVRVPTIVFHGDEDGTVSPRNADQVLAQAGAGALRAESRSFRGDGRGYARTRYTDAAGRVVVEDWRVHGLGHAWSGGSPDGSYTDPQGPDASRAMLDFFAEHPLRSADA